MSLSQALAKALRAARRAKELRQDDLANVTSRSYLALLESGRSGVTLEKLDQIATALRVDPLAIFAMAICSRNDEPMDVTLSRLISEIQYLTEVGAIDELREETAAPRLSPTEKGLIMTTKVHSLREEGLTQKEIADEVGISTATVNKHWHRRIE